VVAPRPRAGVVDALVAHAEPARRPAQLVEPAVLAVSPARSALEVQLLLTSREHGRPGEVAAQRRSLVLLDDHAVRPERFEDVDPERPDLHREVGT
jgi:hypothetical protein